MSESESGPDQETLEAAIPSSIPAAPTPLAQSDPQPIGGNTATEPTPSIDPENPPTQRSFVDNLTARILANPGAVVADMSKLASELRGRRMPNDQIDETLGQVYTNFGINPNLVTGYIEELKDTPPKDQLSAAIPTNNPDICLKIECSQPLYIHFSNTSIENIHHLNQSLKEMSVITGHQYHPYKILGASESGGEK